MEPPKRIELRRKPHLIDANFDGYKLSLKPTPKLEYKLKIGPDQSTRTNEQYSLHHVQLFGMQNHLVSDPWESYSIYFVDHNWTIQSIKYNNGTGELLPPLPVHELKKWDRNYGDFNITFQFVSEKFCILSNGAGKVYIFNTGDRYKNVPWQCVHSANLFPDESQGKFVIANARFECLDGKSAIYLIVISIEQTDSKFENCLDLYKITEEESNRWATEHLGQLKGKSLPEYCEFESKCKSLLICSDHKYSFTLPTVSGNSDGNKEENMEVMELENGNKKNKLAAYTWCQTDEDLMIQLSVAKDVEKDGFKVTCDGKRITVLYNNAALMDSNLFERVESGLTTWQLENESLQLNLLKINSDRLWPNLLENEEEDNNLINILNDQPQRDTSAMAAVGFQPELEDCDYDAGGTDNEFNFERFDLTTKNVTHKISLGMHRPLFTLNLRPNFPSAIVLRHDVDACIWQPQMTSTEWTMNHEGTLNAFGYVQASKLQKKFQQCSPDFGYGIICETSRNIFIYYSQYNTDGVLKNRKGGGKASIGEQKLVTLEKNDEILGIYCADDVTILLTEKSVICLQINVRSE